MGLRSDTEERRNLARARLRLLPGSSASRGRGEGANPGGSTDSTTSVEPVPFRQDLTRL